MYHSNLDPQNGATLHNINCVPQGHTCYEPWHCHTEQLLHEEQSPSISSETATAVRVTSIDLWTPYNYMLHVPQLAVHIT
jgi:hypothetical protein